MPKTTRYQRFFTYQNCYEYHYQEIDRDIIETEKYSKVILELWCGSGAYVRELARQHPENLYIGVDSKSDRLCFGADYCKEHNIDNTKRLRSQIDHLSHCFSKASIDEIWITFPDPRPTRDRQKLSSPKFQLIYKSLLKPNGIIHLKTDDKDFFEYSKKALHEGWMIIWDYFENVYAIDWLIEKKPELWIITYYESIRLEQWRHVYYLNAYYDSTSR